MWPRVIVHADMDAFYAAVEQLDDPGLKGKPVLVGPPGARGVVLTASYEARPFGVGSAMPMALARRRCPQAIVVPPRFDRYREVSRIVMRTFADFSPDVEPLSLDEAFLDLTGAGHIFGTPENIGRRIKSAIREATRGLSVSVGISGTKYVAKVASGHRKPDGLTIVPPAEARAWLAPQPVAVLWGAGPKTQARLAGLGLHTVGDVAAWGEERLKAALGRTGRHFFDLSRGCDPRNVEPSRRAKSLSSERTLTADMHGASEIRQHLRQAASVVARRLRQMSQTARGVRIKLKTRDFRVLTRQRRLREASSASGVISEAAQSLLREIDDPGPFRLIGVAVFEFDTVRAGGQLELAGSRDKADRLDAVLDALLGKFGPGSVRRASDLVNHTVFTDDVNLDYLRDDAPISPRATRPQTRGSR
jgi:DNA polymerase-4